MNSTPSLAQYWHPVAASEDIGDKLTRVTLLGHHLVAFRHADRVSIFDDVCIHRGTALSLGWLTNGRLTCAYHGWEYDGTGACVRIPSLAEGAPIPRKARAQVRSCHEAFGLVWVALENPVAPLPSFPHGEWEDAEYRGIVSNHYEWETSAGRAVENFMDFSHFPFVHEGILGSRDRTIVQPHDIVDSEHGLTYSFDQEEPNTLHSGENELVHWDYYLYRPFTIHLKKTTPSGQVTMISMSASPTLENRSNLWLWVLRNHYTDAAADQTFIDFVHTVMEQDRPVVESQRPEQIPLDLKDELHLKVPDASGIAFRRMLSTIGDIGPYMP